MTTPYEPQTWVNGAGGDTPLSAARLNHMEAGIAAAGTGGAFISVKDHGAVGDGVTDDTTAIQAAIDATNPGDTVWFPGGTYLVSATIVFPGEITILGGGGIGVGTTIKAGAGITDAIIASAAWYNNATTCGLPVLIQGFEIDGDNQGSTVHGLAMLNFHSRVRDVQIRNVTGHGLLQNDTTRNGTNTITNSCSEPTIEQCRFEGVAGDAIHQESNNQIANLDGRVIGCFFADIAGHAVNLGRAAGWAVEVNHYYGIGLDAIRCQNCYATIVRGNYVENFGEVDLAGGFYTGINMSSVLDDRASIIAANTVSTQAPSSPTGSRWACYSARAGSGQLNALVVIDGNSACFAVDAEPVTKRSHAFHLGVGGDTGRLLQVEWGANQIQQIATAGVSWWQATRVVNPGVDLRESGRSGAVTLTDGATVNLDAAMGKLFKLTAAGNRTIAAPTNAVDGQALVIAHTASGGARTLSLTTGSSGAFAFGADITALTATTSGTTDYIGAIYDATAARWRVVSYAKGFA